MYIPCSHLVHSSTVLRMFKSVITPPFPVTRFLLYPLLREDDDQQSKGSLSSPSHRYVAGVSSNKLNLVYLSLTWHWVVLSLDLVFLFVMLLLFVNGFYEYEWQPPCTFEFVVINLRLRFLLWFIYRQRCILRDEGAGAEQPWQVSPRGGGDLCEGRRGVGETRCWGESQRNGRCTIWVTWLLSAWLHYSLPGFITLCLALFSRFQTMFSP